MTVTVEICTDNLQDTVAAIRMGADRIELCSNLDLDGLSPEKGLFEAVLALQPVRDGQVIIFPMIRCRGGGFVFSPMEKQTMLEEAKSFASRTNGLVIGALTEAGAVDIDFVRAVWEAVVCVNPAIELTFHKAIDHVVDFPKNAVLKNAVLLEPYCHRILTSGGALTALAGSAVIRELVDRARRPIPLAAGRIRPENVLQVIAATGVSEVHSRDSKICQTLAKPVRTL